MMQTSYESCKLAMFIVYCMFSVPGTVYKVLCERTFAVPGRVL